MDTLLACSKWTNRLAAGIALLVLALFSCASVWAQDPIPFELSGFSASEVFSIADEEPLLESDPSVAALRNRMGRCSERLLQRFQNITGAVSTADLLNAPDDFRCHVVGVSGAAEYVQPVQWASGGRGYLVQVVDGAGDRCLLCVESIPKRWPVRSSINEPVQATGFFLANYDMVPDTELTGQVVLPEHRASAPLVVAKRMMWYPTDDDSNISVSASMRTLARHKVDIARFDDVKPTGKLTAQDSVLFYQMLSASRSIERPQGKSIDSIGDCLQQPAETTGQMLTLRGRLRRATRVVVEDRDLASLLGQDYYYQLDVFVPLDRRIVIRGAKGASKDGGEAAGDEDAKIVVENRYPVVVCVLDLPRPADELVKNQVVVSGFFLKLWNYRSGHSDINPASPKQITPLLIGLAPEIIQQPDSPLNFWFAIFIGLAVAVAGLVAGIVFVNGRKLKLADSHRGHNLPEQIEIPSID